MNIPTRRVSIAVRIDFPSARATALECSGSEPLKQIIESFGYSGRVLNSYCPRMDRSEAVNKSES